jgi:succinate dehydrogenase hydrophobic anchor subunit
MMQSLSRLPSTVTASGKPTYLGMWTWLTQRFSAILLLILLPWHWVNPYSRPVRIAVLLVVIMHAMAGIRVMLTDVGLAERWHRGLVWILAACGLVIFLYFWLWHV